MYISEYPFHSMVGTNNLIFDVDEVEEVEYMENENVLRIFFIDGFRIYIILKTDELEKNISSTTSVND
jgi:hypothetical protein